MVTIATLVGCAIGDALGNPFEMKQAISPALVEWDGLFKEGGTFWHGQPGQYTDDTLMSMALAASLVEHQGFNPEDVASKYLAWYESGNTRGIGTTTASAMMRLKLGATWEESGLTHGMDSQPAGGNGTAMRASPIGLVYRNDLHKLLEVAATDASITHNSLEPKIGSVVVALATALLANREADPQSICHTIFEIVADSEVKNSLEITKKWLEQGTDLASVAFEAFEEIGKTGNRGYVPETVATAFYCLGATDNFRDCVVMAIKAGGDTDSTAAVAGALAGTYYGLEGIPEEYKSVENFQLLTDLTQELINIEI
jgi:ADP-ribosyl-[dinitrogen reductase] hydrolase